MSDIPQIKTAAWPLARNRVADFVELLKLRLASLVLVTTVVGYYLGAAGAWNLEFAVTLINLVLGTTLVAGSAMVLNQWMERDTDALMERTRTRPIPDGRVAPGEALLFGSVLAVVGLAVLLIFVNVFTALLGALTLASYLWAYTPLKRLTPLCTLVGAVPGAIPPVMGYVAAGNTWDAFATVLFAILFVWQMPHFLAIAWLYRDDYARGGQKMLPVVDPEGVATAQHIMTFSLTLLGVTLMPTILGMTGLLYFGVAAFMGVLFLLLAAKLAVTRTRVAARRVFLASVLYLPMLLGWMMFDRMAG